MTASFGHFSDDGREYVITDPTAPPRAQINFLWNDTLISGVNQFGSGEGIFNDRTLMVNDPRGRVQLIKGGHRYFYLRDNDTGEFWNTGLFPTMREGAKLTTYVGLGYSRFVLEYSGIRVESRVFLAEDEPVEIWEFSIHNASGRARNLSLVPYVEWDLAGYPVFSSRYSYLRSTVDEANHAVLSFNTSDERPHDRYNAFLATDGAMTQWAGGRRDFLGPYGEVCNPRALVTGTMPGAEAWCEDLAGAMMIDASVPDAQTKRLCVVLGSFDTMEEKDRLIAKTRDAGYREKVITRLAEVKTGMIDTVHVRTPDAQMNVLTNVWAKQQIQLCTEFGRDGARGFRDTLQDAWAMTLFNPGLARDKILETLAHQYSDGHTVRGWMPLQPHHYSDGPVWIAMAVTAYIKQTGETDFLNACTPWLDGGDASVMEHTLTGLRHLSDDTGVHGLVLAHEGDWNDSLNWMGKAGKGESVWTSLGLHYGLTLMAELADEVLHDEALADEMRNRRTKIEEAINTHGWDGEWFLAGYSDFGNPVGSHTNREGKIYLNSQTWAVLTGIAKGERLQKCLHAVDTLLESEHGTLTLVPAYTAKDENVGRVTMLLPGMYENSTPYCHGTSFKIVSDCIAGRPDAAYATFHKVMPDSAAHPSTVSGCEPYAYTNQYLGPDNGRAGESISGWITGTAGWMFRAVLEYFLGVKPGYDGLHIQPCFPTEWNEASVDITMRGARYAVEIKRNGAGYDVTVNGAPAPAGFVVWQK